jgi:hypothetical protein
MIRLLRTVSMVGTILSACPTIAGPVDASRRSRDLAEADRLIHGVRLRENSVQQGDWQGLCRLLQQNLRDMSTARELMNPCLTGHDLGENIGQMDASIGDIKYVLDTRCR